MTDSRWVLDSRCGKDPNMTPDDFFELDMNDPVAVERMRRYCGACPVEAQCLGFAMEMDQRHGFWGGKTETERHALRYENDPVRQARQKKTIKSYVAAQSVHLKGPAKA